MKKYANSLFLLICLFYSAIFSCSQAQDISYKVIKIVDGDTVYIDFNNNGICDKDEKVRINGIDTFETKISDGLIWQANKNNTNLQESLGLGYLAKQFAISELLNKYVYAEYSALTKYDKYNRKLMSVFYDCKNNVCKSYEEEILKEGLAIIYEKSNISSQLEKFENYDKLRENAIKTHNMDLVFLNKDTKKYHKINCRLVKHINNIELAEKKYLKKNKPAACCHEQKNK